MTPLFWYGIAPRGTLRITARSPTTSQNAAKRNTRRRKPPQRTFASHRASSCVVGRSVRFYANSGKSSVSVALPLRGSPCALR